MSIFTVPEFDGHPREFSLVWVLMKGRKTARCALWTHPIGAELRVEVDGDLLRSEPSRDMFTLVDRSVEWNTSFKEKGWTL